MDFIKALEQSNSYLSPTDLGNAILHLETTTFCNHRCVFCPHEESARRNRLMDRDLAFRIIREAYEMGVRTGNFFIFGEPLTDPNIFDYHRYASELGYKELVLTTNAGLADDDTAGRLFESGVTTLRVSINAGSRAAYIRTHGKDDYEKAVDFLKQAFEYKNRHYPERRVISSYVLTKDNMSECMEHVERIKNYTDFIFISELSSLAGSVEEEAARLRPESVSNPKLKINLEFTPRIPCPMLKDQICVTAEGYLTVCCMDPSGSGAVEDLNGMSLKDAWLGGKMAEIRTMHMTDSVEGTVCGKCIGNSSVEVKPFNDRLYASCGR